MPWGLEFSDAAKDALDELDRPVRARLDKFFERLSAHPDPRAIGAPLVGVLAGRWRYRVGAYRIICAIRHDVLIIEVIKIGHRREVYRQ